MEAKNISGQAPGGKRMKLAEVLPLATPLVVQIFPIYACNFTCQYCHFSIPVKKRSFVTDKIVMDFKLFKKAIDNLAQFPTRVKTLRFVGMGEPLMHPRIAQMVKYAVFKNVAEKVEILTNASLLTPKMTRALVRAGLTRLVVSLQGTSGQKYQEVSKIKLNFAKFYDNLQYFYHHKKQVSVHLKIVDIALEDKEDEKRFFTIFGKISDTIGLEQASPIFPGVSCNKTLKERKLTQFGLKMKKVRVCPQPFFTMQINPDGKVVPCYAVSYPAILGDINKETLVGIWQGEAYNRFRLRMLDGVVKTGGLCSKCNIIKYRFFPEDDLSKAAKALKKFYK